MRQRLIAITCICVLLVILALGLWPFHAPRNAVAWLKDGNGLRFGDYGTVISSGTFELAGSPNELSCNIEIWLQAALADNEGTILSFYLPNHPPQFSLHQSRTDLTLQSGMGIQPPGTKGARIYVDDVFRPVRLLFVTITSGMQGTEVYVNGTLVRTAQQFRLGVKDCTGRLILGDSALQQDTWQGEVRGLAIYYSELAAPTVRNLSRTLRRQPAYFIELSFLNLTGRIQTTVAG
jgi:hypothetical protein